MYALIFLIPICWGGVLLFGGGYQLVNGIVYIARLWEMPSFVFMLFVMVAGFGWLIFLIWLMVVSINWIMITGLAVLLRPFEDRLQKKVDEALKNRCSEFNRVTGQVRFSIGKNEFFQAPFTEFDAYVERVPQSGGVSYRLMFVHRYTLKTFNETSLGGIEFEKSEVLASWDVLQRYMDITQPLPDVPRLEPFRHLDPVTREYDEKTGRNPRYWQDVDLEVWKQREGQEMLQAQRKFPWGARQCKLTPHLGKVSLKDYREMRPEGAWPV